VDATEFISERLYAVKQSLNLRHKHRSENEMRLFVAINLPPAIKDEATAAATCVDRCGEAVPCGLCTGIETARTRIFSHELRE
jgi:hypothetical protein